MIALPVFVSLALAGQQTLPPMAYRYAMFSTSEPSTAAAFLAKYTGGELISHRSQFQCSLQEGASAAGVRLVFDQAGSYSDVYFVNDPALPGTNNVTEFEKKVARSETFAQDDWTWWQDWHLAFAVDDLDAVAARLLRDGVKFVNRGSLYFPILDTGITIQVLGHATLYWTEPFLFCRHTDEHTTAKMPYYTTNVTSIDTALQRPLPMFIPSHQSMAATDAKACAEWVYSFLNVTKVDTLTGPGQSHQYANGTCANIQWMATQDGYSIHFIEQFVKREGLLSMHAHEEQVRRHHGKLSTYDAYMSYRVAFSVPDLRPLIDIFSAASEPFFRLSADENAARILVMPPNGYIFEIFENRPVTMPRMGKNMLRGQYDAQSARHAISTAIHE